MRRVGFLLIVVGVAGACVLPESGDFARAGGGDGADAGPDAAIVDAAGLAEAGVDAEVDAGDSGASVSVGCKAHPSAIYCADFDDNPFDVGFTRNPIGDPPGQLDVDRNVFLSAPAAAMASLGDRTVASTPGAFFYHQLPDSASSSHISWSAAYDDHGAQDAVDYGVSPVKQTTGVFHSIALRYRHGADGSLSLTLFEYGAPDGTNQEVVDFTPIPVVPPAGRFVRYEFDLVQSATSSSVTVLFDEAVALANHPLSFHLVSGPVGLRVGLASDGVGSPFVVHVDDIVVDP